MFVLLLFSLIPMALSGCPPGAYDLTAFGKCAVLEKSGQDFGYFEAELACQDKGGHLMSIQNGFENSILTAFAAEANIAGGIYIGADKHKKADWTWTDGSSLNYTNWAAGNPKVGKQCAVLHVDDGKWYSEECVQSIPYFCEVLKEKELSCPPEWTLFNNSCYHKQQTDFTTYTWTDARLVCLQMRGDLASIHSAEENNFIAPFVNASSCTRWWIGLQYSSTAYSWSDATPVTYTNIVSGDEMFPGYGVCPTCCNPNSHNGKWSGYSSIEYLWSFVCKRAAAKIGSVNNSATKQDKKTPATDNVESDRTRTNQKHRDELG